MTHPEAAVLGVYETVLYARDVEATARFYAGPLGLRALEASEGLGAVFRLDDGGVLLIFDPERASEPGRYVPAHGADGPGHIAFSVAPGGLEAFAARLQAAGIEVEREITWGQGGRSLYVRDPAGNSVELIEGEAWPA
jgi:catechol 2,3-dioxygenase-like lactoylglutathione lyase family enzyme